MSIPAQSIFEVQFVYDVNGQVCRNVFHFRNDNELIGIFGPEMSDLILTQHFGGPAAPKVAAFLNAVSEDATLNEVTCQMIYETRWRVQRSDIGEPGTIASPCEAQNLTVSVSKTGDQANRHGRGGFHLGGVPQNGYEDGLVTALLKGQVFAFATEILANFNVLWNAANRPFTAVILNKVLVGLPDNPHYIIDGSMPVTAWEVQDELRTQRTRNVGRGE